MQLELKRSYLPVAKKTSLNLLIQEALPTTLGCWQASHDNHHLHSLIWLGWHDGSSSNLSYFACRVQQAINDYTKTAHLDYSIVSPQIRVSQFQSMVLDQLCKIPLGQTRTYGEIAKILTSSPRAVGQACRSNPIQLFIPCHRVVSKTGLGGYMGKKSQLDLKSFLLNHEKSGILNEVNAEQLIA